MSDPEKEIDRGRKDQPKICGAKESFSQVEQSRRSISDTIPTVRFTLPENARITPAKPYFGFILGITNIVDHLEELKRKNLTLNDSDSLEGAIEMFLLQYKIPSAEDLGACLAAQLNDAISKIVEILSEMDKDLASAVSLSVSEFLAETARS